MTSRSSSENATSAVNQQETFRTRRRGSSETTRETPQITKAYLLGAIKDSTETKYTYRISQKGTSYVSLIATSLRNMGYKAWTYREGKNRDVYVVEFAKKILQSIKIVTRRDKTDFIRGYFDAEGGIAKSPKVRYYIYFCQKNAKELETLTEYLIEFGISTGKIHNPSKKVDPNYWRFYISSKSYKDFYMIIGSSHPDKSKYLRMVIQSMPYGDIGKHMNKVALGESGAGSPPFKEKKQTHPSDFKVNGMFLRKNVGQSPFLV